MRFKQLDLDSCGRATGLVVVVDVIRAFTTAAYAFAAGAEKIILVSTVEEALGHKAQDPDVLVIGEVGGLPPAGFDYGNSPTQIAALDLRGRTLIQRTGAGTQGAVRSVKADRLLAASFCVASATADYIRLTWLEETAFVLSGVAAGGRGDEDRACAEYLQALVEDKDPDPAPFVRRVYESQDAQMHLDPDQPQFPASDLEYCTRISNFDFAMPIARLNGGLVMRAIKP